MAKAAGIPLLLMDGFYEAPSADVLKWLAPRDGGPECGSIHGPLLSHWLERALPVLPISWDSLRPDVLHVLLNHSDCDGELPAEICAPLADRLEELLGRIDADEDGGGHIGLYREKTQEFIDGLRAAASAGESVEFH